MKRPVEIDPGSIRLDVPLMWWVSLCFELELSPTASFEDVLQVVRRRGPVLPESPVDKASPIPPGEAFPCH